LQNKVAIITGAAHGIGKAYARQFAEEAPVVIADIDEKAGRPSPMRSSIPVFSGHAPPTCATFPISRD
jgi:NAD(P)-dependent dehydrogenase (short-subunit alcohol dehydrogenase family)